MNNCVPEALRHMIRGYIERAFKSDMNFDRQVTGIWPQAA